MKISNETIEVLKNFSSINTGLLVKAGNNIQTISPAKNILASASVAETFPVEFAIYDLSSFLGILSMFKDEPEVDFGNDSLTVKGYNGRSKIVFRYTEKSLIITPPEKKMNLPSEDINFTLSSEDLTHLLRGAAVLQSPEIKIEVEDGKVFVSAVDAKNNASNVMRLEVAQTNAEPVSVILRTENIKIINKAYNVTICKQGISKFESTDGKITYWIATEIQNG